jgi:hypothetical protein
MAANITIADILISPDKIGLIFWNHFGNFIWCLSFELAKLQRLRIKFCLALIDKFFMTHGTLLVGYYIIRKATRAFDPSG